jgi:hypothetical protein
MADELQKKLLAHHLMDMEEIAKEALEDANTSDGYWVAVSARQVAFNMALQLERHERLLRDEVSLKSLMALAELDLKRAEVDEKRQEIEIAARKAEAEIVNLSWEGRKLQEETFEIARKIPEVT